MKPSNYFILIVSFILSFFTLPESYRIAKAQDLQTQLDNHLKSYVTNEQFQGVVLVAKDGNILFKRAYGFADHANQVKNQVSNQFLIGSLTKSLTAVAVMRLVDKGLINLHAPIRQYIPKLKSELAEGLTMHLLMKQQSGLPRHLEQLAHFEDKDVSSADILNIINRSKRSFAPGSDYEYSNLNYHLAALVIEHVTGKGYVEAMEELLFKPIKMDRSGVERKCNQSPDRVKGYRKGYLGLNHDENIVSYALGSGDVYSTVDDLLRFDQALYPSLNHPEFLSKSSIEILFKGEDKDHGYYGYGFRIREYRRKDGKENGILTRHGGSMDGFSSNFHRYTDDKLTVIVLANVRRFPIRQLTYELKEIALGYRVGERERDGIE